MRVGLVLGVALMMMQATPPGAPKASLGELRDHARPLLIFSVSEKDPRFQRQAAELASHAPELMERQVIGISLPIRGDLTALDSHIWSTAYWPIGPAERQRLHIGNDRFVVVLIGKDGGEKQRWTRPVTVAELDRVIDSMPGRQDEMRQARKNPQPPQ